MKVSDRIVQAVDEKEQSLMETFYLTLPRLLVLSSRIKSLLCLYA